MDVRPPRISQTDLPAADRTHHRIPPRPHRNFFPHPRKPQRPLPPPSGLPPLVRRRRDLLPRQLHVLRHPDHDVHHHDYHPPRLPQLLLPQPKNLPPPGQPPPPPPPQTRPASPPRRRGLHLGQSLLLPLRRRDHQPRRLRRSHLPSLPSPRPAVHRQNVHFLLLGPPTSQLHRRRQGQGQRSQRIRRLPPLYRFLALHHGQRQRRLASPLGSLLCRLSPHHHRGPGIAHRIQCLFEHTAQVPFVQGASFENGPGVEHTEAFEESEEDRHVLPTRLSGGGEERDDLSEFGPVGGHGGAADGVVGADREGAVVVVSV
mmetsp:Transcript_20949/g.44022  ORF Transcript_20949/g.44022 Transcript_20949/m.44022 type:complete len:316 (+) Transcript_20949:304-1251(+)